MIYEKYFTNVLLECKICVKMSRKNSVELDNTTLDTFSSSFDWTLVFGNDSSNSSEDQFVGDGKELWREIPLGIVLTFLCLLTTVGNAMVLHAVRTERRLQSVSNMFIVSLAIADLIVGLVVMPISTVYIFTDEWLFGIAVCQIWIGIDYTASTASILNLFILSLDRYWSVTSPLKYLRKRTKKRAVLMITGVWCLSSMWIVPIIGWHHFFFGGERSVPSSVCDTEYAKNSAFKVVTAFFNFYLPLAIMYCLYWKIFQEIRKRSELELGQRNVKNYASPLVNNQSCVDDISFSDNNIDTHFDSHSHTHIENPHITHIPIELSIFSMSTKHSNNHRTQKTTRGKRCKGYFVKRFLKSPRKDNRLKVIQNGAALELPSTTISQNCKIEYVYDENVIDEETEKVERYFYEEFSSIKPQQQPPHALIMMNSNNTSADLSTPSTPKSSSSSTEDRRTLANKTANYSLISGLRRIREAESIIDTTCTATSNSKTSGSSRNQFVFRDERSRRHSTNVFNIKNRIKNIRQSSALTKEIKAARQLGVIMGAFTLCFLPYFILFLVVAFCDGCIDQGLLLAMTWVGYLNSTLNPFLYPLCNANFRRKFRMMLGMRSKRSRFRRKNGHERNSMSTARYD
ncbi:histamine H1 receptor-like [Mya arenaria]|uniref:histamine H1 receptor-like n=1 Tax=Mya arenaria TaxID=6604 RepID=UPI0022E256EB|nr:histamine H1 receptor-like [Mya arenaria]